MAEETKSIPRDGFGKPIKPTPRPRLVSLPGANEETNRKLKNDTNEVQYHSPEALMEQARIITGEITGQSIIDFIERNNYPKTVFVEAKDFWKFVSGSRIQATRLPLEKDPQGEDGTSFIIVHDSIVRPLYPKDRPKEKIFY